jgi:hypothetical protein
MNTTFEEEAVPGRNRLATVQPLSRLAGEGVTTSGAERDRTVGLLSAIQALSQLSYSPDRS